VTPTPEAPLTGKEADVMLACYQAADLAVATIAPGVTNAKVTVALHIHHAVVRIFAWGIQRCTASYTPRMFKCASTVCVCHNKYTRSSCCKYAAKRCTDSVHCSVLYRGSCCTLLLLTAVSVFVLLSPHRLLK
jgi:hypothetical protein